MMVSFMADIMARRMYIVSRKGIRLAAMMEKRVVVMCPNHTRRLTGDLHKKPRRNKFRNLETKIHGENKYWCPNGALATVDAQFSNLKSLSDIIFTSGCISTDLIQANIENL